MEHPIPDPREQVRAAVRAVGVRALARWLGHSHPATASRWARDGAVAVKHWSAFNAAMRAHGVAEVSDDVFRRAYEESKA